MSESANAPAATEAANATLRVFRPKGSFELKAAWPKIFPDMRITFHVRMMLNNDESEVQKKFFMLPDEGQDGEAYHLYDAEMLTRLSVAPPEGLPGFQPQGDGSWRDQLRGLLLPADPDERAGMAFICRGLMSLYWRAVQPVDFL